MSGRKSYTPSNNPEVTVTLSNRVFLEKNLSEEERPNIVNGDIANWDGILNIDLDSEDEIIIRSKGKKTFKVESDDEITIVRNKVPQLKITKYTLKRFVNGKWTREKINCRKSNLFRD